VVVIGCEGEKVRRALRSINAVVVENENWRRGIGSSIRIGVEALIKEERLLKRPAAVSRPRQATAGQVKSPLLGAAVLLVCDQPFVDANTIQSLIALRQTTRKEIIASSYANTLGVPGLFGRSFFRELLSLNDGAGAKSIILRNRRRVAHLPFPEGKIDIDSWDDWKKLNKRSLPERSEGSHTS